MSRYLLVLALGMALGVGGAAAAFYRADGEPVRRIKTRDIKEKLDGKDSKLSIVELTLRPGDSGQPHRHPGPVFAYVLEGEYEFGIDDEPAKVLKAGETFYEPTGCLHRVSKNPSANTTTRVIAFLVLPRDAQPVSGPDKQ